MEARAVGKQVGSDGHGGPDPQAEVHEDAEKPAWQLVFADPTLSRPPAPGSPGRVAPGDDLSLDIGWERFEQLLVAVARSVLGLDQARFRRYGVEGQAQHGIDLAGRRSDGEYTVVQCKEYDRFTATNLRAAVDKFATGKRPFGAKHLIVAVSTVARSTQLEDELAVLQDEHQDLRIELWGAEQINEVLRDRADIVSRFWTRETAETFCTGAPLPGVAAPPPNWVRVADQILLGPLTVDGIDEQLADAHRLRVSKPHAAAAAYGRLADRLTAEGFTEHAHVMRRKQLEALVDAVEVADAAALAAHLIATALHEGDIDQARRLSERLDTLQRDHARESAQAAETADEATAAIARHAHLMSAALHAANHPLGESSALIAALRNPPGDMIAPAYQPLLVLFLGELTIAEACVTPPEQAIMTGSLDEAGTAMARTAARVAELDDLFTSALDQLAAEHPGTDKDLPLRLRLVRAFYDADERINLLTLARQLRLPRKHAGLVLAGQARRDALDGSADEALEHWRRAVSHAILEGRTDDAGAWLYAIRAVNTRYGPWTGRIDEEHLLAQSLPKTGSGRLIRRVRDPETDARRVALDNRPGEAVRAARRWLADSIITGDWVNEHDAAELLGDLYALNREPERAATCYQWAGEDKKLTQLAKATGDRLLPPAPVSLGPWWQQSTSLAGVAAQHDLLNDDTAGSLLNCLLDLVARGRAGELIDSPTGSLTVQATKTACRLAGRGSSSDAQKLLDLLAPDVSRRENQYHYHDKEHVQACETIAAYHEALVWPALVRNFDLAEVGVPEALNALKSRRVLDLLREPSRSPHDAPTAIRGGRPSMGVSKQQRQQLQERLHQMAASGRYDAGLAAAMLGGTDPAVTERALAARNRLINRPEADGRTFSYGTRLVADSYLVTFLTPDDQHACLDKMLTIAEDRREGAHNRQDALTAAGNLVLDQPEEVKAAVHERSRTFVNGHQDGSFLDAETSDPHPLSAIKINLGSTSLRAPALRLAKRSAITNQHREWVRDQAAIMLGSSDDTEVRQAVETLYRLNPDIIGELDPTLLAGHPLPIARQLAAVIAVAAPARHAAVIQKLAADPDSPVRAQLAHLLHQAQSQVKGAVTDYTKPSENSKDSARAADPAVTEVLARLTKDRRHPVRRAAAGLVN